MTRSLRGIPSLPELPKLPPIGNRGPRKIRVPGVKVPLQSVEDPLTLARYQKEQTTFPGSLPEFMVFRWLEDHGYQPWLDFIFQSELLGGPSVFGGVKADFVLPGMLGGQGLLLRVQGLHWHYDSTEVQVKDARQRSMLEADGWVVVDVDEDAIYERLDWVMREALRGADHSRKTEQEGG